MTISVGAIDGLVSQPDERSYSREHSSGPTASSAVSPRPPNSESALETLGRFTSIEFDLPMPVSNARVGRGKPEWRLDGLLPFHRIAQEGDGATKDDNRSDASQIVRKQNEREYGLRRLGLEVVRYGWREAWYQRNALAGRFAAVMRERPPGEPVRWWKHVPGVGPVDPEPQDWPSPHPLGLILPAGWDEDLDPLRQHDAAQEAVPLS